NALAGTPTTPGTYNFTIKATDANGCTGTRAYTLTINCPTVSVSPASLPNGQMGVAYNQSLTATGGAAPYSVGLSAAPSPNGLTLSAAGALAGTPTASGAFNFTIKATDANGCFGSSAFTLTTNGCPTVTLNPASLPNGTQGTVYNQSLTA